MRFDRNTSRDHQILVTAIYRQKATADHIPFMKSGNDICKYAYKTFHHSHGRSLRENCLGGLRESDPIADSDTQRIKTDTL